jgi:hypothetical protein
LNQPRPTPELPPRALGRWLGNRFRALSLVAFLSLPWLGELSKPIDTAQKKGQQKTPWPFVLFENGGRVMQVACVVLLLALFQISEPPGQSGDGAFSADALQKLDMELKTILEAQRLLTRMLYYYHCLGIGFGGRPLEWNWPDDLMKIFWKKPPDHSKKKEVDPGERAMKQLDKQLSGILDGQDVIYRKLSYFYGMSLRGSPLPDMLNLDVEPAWDWPEELKKLDEKIFGRRKKPPVKK